MSGMYRAPSISGQSKADMFPIEALLNTTNNAFKLSPRTFVSRFLNTFESTSVTTLVAAVGFLAIKRSKRVANIGRLQLFAALSSTSAESVAQTP